MVTVESKEKYVLRDYGIFVGKTIKTIRPLTESECRNFGWDFIHEDYAVFVEFTDGSGFVPMRDPEGNGSGFLAEVPR